MKIEKNRENKKKGGAKSVTHWTYILLHHVEIVKMIHMLSGKKMFDY
jgi:hypothetical protein